MMRHFPPSSEGTKEQDQAVTHFHTNVLGCVLNNAQAISLPSLEDLEVVSTSIFSLTRDLITFVIRSSSSLGKEGGGKEGRSKEGVRREGEEKAEEKVGERIHIQEHRLLQYMQDLPSCLHPPPS